jgi:hypothetical protein
MMVKLRWGCISALLLLAATLGLDSSFAQRETLKYFPETGHQVQGDFLTTYTSVSNPLLLFGYPITDEFRTQTESSHPNLRVQYFQRSRFEYHPENPDELRVILTNLGELIYSLDQPGTEISVSTNIPTCRFFPDTNHHVCYAFLDFFDSNGGIAQFGYPISEIEIRDGRLVQYFQRSRFEWHPELTSGQRVILTDLGALYFDLYENKEYLNSKEIDSNIPSPVLDLKVFAFVEKAVINPGLIQEIFVIVRDQRYRALTNAQVVFMVKLSDGKEERFIMPLTNDHGITALEFPTRTQPWGVAEISVTVTYDKFQKQTRTSYRVWW